MSIEQRGVCVLCGQPFSYLVETRGRPRKYCGAECRSKKRGGKKCGYGLSANAAVCRNCGRDFVRKDGSNRACCCEGCAIVAVRRETSERMCENAPGEVRDWVLSLILNGYGIKEIASALSLNRRTAQSWVARYRGKRETRKRRTRFSFPQVRSAEEWLDALRSETVEPKDGGAFAGCTVYLVCGATNTKCSADHLAAIVLGRLKNDASDGGVYVFCNVQCSVVRLLLWDAGGFSLLTRRREFGAYPWPSRQVGSVVKTTSQDLERILFCERKNIGNRSLTWYDVQLPSSEKSE